MANDFVRSIKNVRNINKQPLNTNEQTDLLSDDKHVYVRNKDQYENLTNAVKSVNNKTIDKNGNVNVEIKDFTGQEKFVRKNQLDEALEGIESGYKNYTDNAIEDIDINDRNYFSPSKVNNLAFLGSGESNKIEESSIYRGYSLPVSGGEIYSISRSSKTNNRFRIGYTSSEPKDGMVYFGSTSTKYDNALKAEGLLVPEGAEYMVVYLSNKGDELPNIKIQKGKATGWTPAPEDLVDEAKKYTDSQMNGLDIPTDYNQQITITPWQDITIKNDYTASDTPDFKPSYCVVDYGSHKEVFIRFGFENLIQSKNVVGSIPSELVPYKMYRNGTTTNSKIPPKIIIITSGDIEIHQNEHDEYTDTDYVIYEGSWIIHN